MLFSSANLDNSNCVEEIGKTFSLWFVFCTYVLIYDQGRELFSYIQHSGSPEPAFGISLIVSRFFNLYPSVETRKNNKLTTMLKKIFSFAAFVCLLCSCSGIPKEREVIVSDIDITGFIKSYVKVVDGTYKFTSDDDKAYISVKLELTDKPDVEFHQSNNGRLRLTAIGDNGIVFDTGSYGFESGYNELTKIEELLKGDIGNTKTIAFAWNYLGSQDEIRKSIFTNAVSFELVDTRFESGDNGARITKSSSTSSTTSDSKDWDKALDDYEAYIDSYIKLLKKAQAGDLSAMTEYPTCLEKAEAFSKKFDNAKGSMSTKQMKRYMEITTKMTTAAMP